MTPVKEPFYHHNKVQEGVFLSQCPSRRCCRSFRAESETYGQHMLQFYIGSSQPEGIDGVRLQVQLSVYSSNKSAGELSLHQYHGNVLLHGTMSSLNTKPCKKDKK